MSTRFLLIAALSLTTGLVVTGLGDESQAAAGAADLNSVWVLSPWTEQASAVSDDGVLDWYREKDQCPRYICDAYPCCQTTEVEQLALHMSNEEPVCGGESVLDRVFGD
ncbi:MAG: hypothetical protein RQ745_06165 [Longimicrobiales bacterium]|nr:hypothetical protein [Longimicrobiales bacterium]